MLITAASYLISHTDLFGIKYMRNFMSNRVKKLDFNEKNSFFNDSCRNLISTVIGNTSATQVVILMFEDLCLDPDSWIDFEKRNTKIIEYSLQLLKHRFSNIDKIETLNSAIQANIYSHYADQNNKKMLTDKILIKNLETILLYVGVELRHLQLIHKEQIETLVSLNAKKITEKAHKIHAFCISDLLNDCNLILQNLQHDRKDNCAKCHIYTPDDFQDMLNTLNMISSFRSFDNYEAVGISHLLDLFNAFKRPSCCFFGFELNIINYCESDTKVMAQDMFYIALLNILFENATESNATHFDITIDSDGSNLIIVFTNNGETMSQEQISNCFQMFCSTKTSKHYGLSLNYIKNEGHKLNIDIGVLSSEIGAKFILKTVIQKSVEK